MYTNTLMHKRKTCSETFYRQLRIKAGTLWGSKATHCATMLFLKAHHPNPLFWHFSVLAAPSTPDSAEQLIYSPSWVKVVVLKQMLNYAGQGVLQDQAWEPVLYRKFRVHKVNTGDCSLQVLSSQLVYLLPKLFRSGIWLISLIWS